MSLTERERVPAAEQAGDISSVNPELSAGSHAEVLRELLTVPDELAAELRPKVYDAAAQLSATIFNTKAQRALELYAGIADWYLFGKPGQPFPQGLILGYERLYSVPDAIPSLDTAEPYLNMRISLAHSRLMKLGLGEAVAAVESHLSCRREIIHEVVQDYIKQSNEYAVLAAFDQPNPDTTQQPLSTYWHQIREMQEAQAVQHRYSLNPGEPMTRDNSAYFELQQRRHRIDEETQWRQGDGDDTNSLERVRQLFMSYILDDLQALDRIPSSYPPSRLSVRSDKEIARKHPYHFALTVHWKSEDDENGEVEHDYPMGALIYDVVKAFSKDYRLDNNTMEFITRVFVAYAAHEVLDPRGGGNLTDRLHQALEESAAHIAGVLLSAHGARDYYGSFQFAEQIMLLKRPEGQSQPVPNYVNGDWRELLYQDMHLASRSEYQRNANQRLGSVEQYGPLAYRVPMRLMVDDGAPVKILPVWVDAADLVIKDDYYSLQRNLHVPGYVLVSANNVAGDFRYVVDPEGDPYAPCQVLLTQEALINLQETYRTIGLEQLAEELKASPHVTVAELTDLIRKHATYYLPDSFAGEREWDVASSLDARKPELYDLKDFSKLVVDGKLQLQCTTAADFLKQSLQECSPQAAIGTVDGYVINGSSSIINGVKHVQVTFVHEGKQYILDSTPSLDVPIEQDYEPYKDYVDDGHEQYAASIPSVDLPEQPEAETKYHATPELTPAEEIDGLYRSLQEQLKIIFDTRELTTVEKRLVKLPKHDPVRRSYEAFARYGNGRVTLEQLAELAAYTAGCADATEQARRKLGIQHYTPDFLQQLAGMSARFAQLAASINP